jgi:Zn-dependent M28 family amino/carboxypeptidase
MRTFFDFLPSGFTASDLFRVTGSQQLAIAFIAFIALSTSLSSSAQDLYDKKDIAHAKKAIEIAQKSDLAYDLIASLTSEVGPRPAGSENDAKAVAWAMAKLGAMGFDRVWKDPIKVDAWKRISGHADLVAPYQQHLAVAALGNSISTPAEGISAEVEYYENFDALKTDTSGRAKGKIVFVDNVFVRSRDGRGYGQAVPVRINGAIEASKRGAAAIVIRSVGTDSDRLPHTGTMRYDEKEAPPIPAAAISTPDGDLIRLIARERTKPGSKIAPLKIALHMKNSTTKGVDSHNVIAEIRGSEKPDEVIAIGGHLDSWDLGTGAIDDGAGVAITVATAKILKDMGVRPKRTIRVILFGNEENGLDGGRDYAAKYGKQKHQLIAESDLGAGSIYRMTTRVDEATRPWLKAIADVIAPLGIEWGENTGGGGPDFGPTVNGFGHPAAALSQDATKYFDIHHTANDTLDKIDPKEMKQNVAAWVAMVWLAAQADHSFSGPPKK